MRIGGDPAIRVLQQQHVAEAAHLVAGIGDDAAFGRPHRGTQRCGDVDAVIVPAAALRPELGDDAALHRPVEAPASRRGALAPVAAARCLIGRIRRRAGRGRAGRPLDRSAGAGGAGGDGRWYPGMTRRCPS